MPTIALVKLIAAGIIALGLLSTVGYGWYKWNDMKATITSQQNLLVANDLKIQEQDKVIIQTIEDIRLQKEINDDLRADVSSAANRARDMENRFNKVSKLMGERDFGKLAVAKPDVVQRLINNGTTEMIRCFEISSGSDLTEEEVNAKQLSELNSICSNLANPNRSIK